MQLEKGDHIMWAQTTGAAGHRVSTGRWFYAPAQVTHPRLSHPWSRLHRHPSNPSPLTRQCEYALFSSRRVSA